MRYGDAAYEWTPSGSLKTKTTAAGTTRYTYDLRGALREVTLADGRQLSYVIDGHGRRVGKKVGGQLVQGLLYQSALQPVAELDGAGTVKSTFVYANHANVPDYLVREGVAYKLITDVLGSVRLVVNTQTGEIAQRIDYDAFGRVLDDTAPGFQPFGFAGGVYDADTGLVRFGARDYDADTGRWTAKDPIRFRGGDPNLYAYVGNDPVNLIDPSGTIVAVLAGGVAGGALIGGLVGAILGGVKAGVTGGDWSAVASSALSGGMVGALTGGLTGLGVVIPTAATVAIVGEGAIGMGAQFAVGFGVAAHNPKWPGLAATAATTLLKDVMNPQKVSGQLLEGTAGSCP